MVVMNSATLAQPVRRRGTTLLDMQETGARLSGYVVMPSRTEENDHGPHAARGAPVRTAHHGPNVVWHGPGPRTYRLGCAWWEIQSEVEKARRRMLTGANPTPEFVIVHGPA